MEFGSISVEMPNMSGTWAKCVQSKSNQSSMHFRIIFDSMHGSNIIWHRIQFGVRNQWDEKHAIQDRHQRNWRNEVFFRETTVCYF